VARDAAGSVGSAQKEFMTLVAAYREREVPVLVGDLLITDAQGRPVSTLKKTHRLRPNLVVGWTGNKYQATRVLNELRSLLDASGPDAGWKTLNRVLTSIRVGEYLPVTLVGWMHNIDSVAFVWHSNHPDEVFRHDEYFFGSGAPAFQDIAAGRAGPGPDNVTERILWHLGLLMADEGGDRYHQLAEKFGGGYDVLTLNAEGAFDYLDDVLFLFAEAKFDGAGNYLRCDLIPLVYALRHAGEYAIVERIRLSGLVARGVTLITPAYDSPPEELASIQAWIRSPEYPAWFSAPHWCLYTTFIRDGDTPREQILPAPLVTTAGPHQPNPIFTVEWDDGLKVVMPPRNMLMGVYQDQTRNEQAGGRL